MDVHGNFGYGTVLTPPSPALSGTTLTLAADQGDEFPSSFPYELVISPLNTTPLRSNSEIVQVTGRTDDTLTIVRAQRSTSARAVVATDVVALAPLAHNFDDIEAALDDKMDVGAAAGGDLSGTYPNPSVSNDSHSHGLITLAQATICQARLTCTGTTAQTTLYLVPCNGNVIYFNGTLLTLTGYGCSITNSGLATSTLYYAYVYSNAGVAALELSATAPTSLVGGTEMGVRYKTGDITRLLVGMVYTDAASKFNKFAGGATAGKMNVLSWWNQMRVFVAGYGLTGGGGPATTTSAAATWEDVATEVENHFEFLTWGALLGVSPSFVCGISGSAAVNAVTTRADLEFGTVGRGSATPISSVMGFTSVAANDYSNVSGSSTQGLDEGHHQFMIWGRVYGGAGATLSVYVNSFGETNG